MDIELQALTQEELDNGDDETTHEELLSRSNHRDPYIISRIVNPPGLRWAVAQMWLATIALIIVVIVSTIGTYYVSLTLERAEECHCDLPNNSTSDANNNTKTPMQRSLRFLDSEAVSAEADLWDEVLTLRQKVKNLEGENLRLREVCLPSGLVMSE
eukprot:TRINITY_DN8045_c0_g1_i1.p1 TRINITY_DN8045_c0_g1~~TRINITY_DN8045_c0_g1_i1.p1  ORF type:complete len:157 (-),score=23.40 TRINITY_DN8045_c0_g1_i1:101-571(-)